MQLLHHFLKRKSLVLYSLFPFFLSKKSDIVSLNLSQPPRQSPRRGERILGEERESLDGLMNRGNNLLWTTFLPLGFSAEKNI